LTGQHVEDNGGQEGKTIPLKSTQQWDLVR
jgi:hypothetical protein